MLALRRTVFTLAALGMWCSQVCAQQPAESQTAQPLPECEVIARANSEVILACELEWQVRLMIEQRLGSGVSKAVLNSPMLAEARETLMRNLISGRMEMALLYADFRSNAPQADISAIQKQLIGPFEETEVPRLMENVGVEDRADLEARLISLGTSIAERREDFYRTMIARSWLQESVKINREVTHEQMLDYYHEHVDGYAQPDRARWEELMIRFEGYGSKREAYAAIASIGNEAHRSANLAAVGTPAFDGIAKKKSQGFTASEGGAHDWTTRDSLAAESINQAIFTLPVGQMSPILEGPVGFHIVRVLERKDAGPTPFREVQGKIKEDLRSERFNAAINAKLTELKKTARLWTIYTGDISYKQLAELQKQPVRR